MWFKFLSEISIKVMINVLPIVLKKITTLICWASLEYFKLYLELNTQFLEYLAKDLSDINPQDILDFLNLF
jgi:hypothetical protein